MNSLFPDMESERFLKGTEVSEMVQMNLREVAAKVIKLTSISA